MVQDKKLLQKFAKIMRMSNRITKQDAAKMMKISHDKLLELLFEWGNDLSFKLESDEIVITDSEDFAKEVDALFGIPFFSSNLREQLTVSMKSVRLRIFLVADPSRPI